MSIVLMGSLAHIFRTSNSLLFKEEYKNTSRYLISRIPYLL
ncbi:Bgt-50949 [Blumeria graminis f. sp. tritici]|uniref:Bgt-50949 n=1 Tax=Blumeria graminis f. sp. tritici TaxID=62690 RepID=A0A9X9PRR3_BLUGR|nr:Bgt-50949 [Blumeria graminis f. sp. tritici]